MKEEADTDGAGAAVVVTLPDADDDEELLLLLLLHAARTNTVATETTATRFSEPDIDFPLVRKTAVTLRKRA